MNKYLKYALISAILTLPLLGFFYGLVSCGDCNTDLLSNTLGRIFIGIMSAIFIVLGGGSVMDNEGGTGSTNLQVYIIPTFLVIFVTLLIVSRVRAKKQLINQKNASSVK